MQFNKSLACAALLAVAAAGARADDFNLSLPLVPSVALPGSFSAAYGVTHILSGAFTDTFTFTGAASGQVSASMVAIGFLPSNTFELSSVTLNGTPLSVTSTGGLSVASLPLTAFNGPLTLTISGIAAPTLASGTAIAASYAGTVNVSAVPEPQPAALLLAGMGVVGLLARRRFS